LGRAALQRALITGASSGLGRALAVRLAGEGYALALVARRRPELDRVAAEIRAKRQTAEADVEAIDLVETSAGATLFARVPDVDLLVNNAGFGTTGPFLAQDWATYRRVIDLQVRVLAHLAWLYAGAMKARGAGTIMNIGALAGFGPTPNFAMFGA